MPLTGVYSNLGTRFVPQDVKDMRRSSLDYHRKLGMPVFHKHRWNYRDYQEGRAMLCPYNDENYGYGDQPYDDICFGTGFIGGFSDAELTWITISDSTEDTVRIGPGGVLIAHTTPGFTAPWTPDMGDGDLVVTGDFSEDGEMIYPRERYLLGEVDTITLRGFQDQVQTKEFPVNQAGQLSKLPWEHRFYKVPLVFDYDNIPDVPVVPPGTDPNDYPPIVGMYTSRTWGIRVIGRPGFSTRDEYPVTVVGLGTEVSAEAGARTIGVSGGIEWNW